MHAVAPTFGLFFIFAVPLGILAILAFVFWIWALINAITNPLLGSGEKVAWVLVILFLHFLGALIYLLAGRRT